MPAWRQPSALKTWGGEAANVAAAQSVHYLHWARMNGLARSGDSQAALEPAA